VRATSELLLPDFEKSNMSMSYRADIDGLRAIAVLAVIFFHAGIYPLGGGFVGVDVFFVISGYLITSHIRADIAANSFSLRDFYDRRARRILPALVVVIAVTAPLAWAWLLPQDLKSFSQSVVATSLFASNIYFWRTTDYFSQQSELRPLLHTWSLAVEEQFYVLYPLLIVGLARFGQAGTRKALLTLAILSWGATYLIAKSDPTSAFYFLHTRAWELLAGALVALTVGGPSREAIASPLRSGAAMLGLALIAISIFSGSDRSTANQALLVVPVLGTCLWLAFGHRDSLAGRLLVSKPLVAIGLISYSAYLWHQPVFSLIKHRFATTLSLPAKFAVILFVLAMAALTYRWVEQPFRNRAKIPIRRVAAMLGGATALFVALGVSGHIFNGYPGRFPADSRMPADLELATSDNGWCFYSIDSNRKLPLKPNPGGCFIGKKDERGKKVLLFGDSYAGQYEPFWDVLGKSASWKIESVTTNWCFPARGHEFTGYPASPAYRQCEYNRAYAQREIPKARVVVLGGSWGAILTAGYLDAVRAFIQDAAAKAPLVVVMPTPVQYDLSPLAFYEKSVLYGNSFRIEDISRKRDEAARQADEQITAFAKGLGNVIVLSRADVFGSGRKMFVTDGDVPFSVDGLHISVHGARRAAETFLQRPRGRELMQRLGRR
jgi:peptidoglycan/LPS O-acetylase OafA/YrhL